MHQLATNEEDLPQSGAPIDEIYLEFKKQYFELHSLCAVGRLAKIIQN